MAPNLVPKETDSSMSFEQASSQKMNALPFDSHDPGTTAAVLPPDRLDSILAGCRSNNPDSEEEGIERRIFSLKLDLRAVKEGERMAGLMTEEDFEELNFLPKTHDFLSNIYHEESAKQSFWSLLRTLYLSMLRPERKASVIQEGEKVCGNPSLLLAELFRLPEMKDRLGLIGRMSYQEFEAMMQEAENRSLSLRASLKEFLNATNVQNQEGKKPARRTRLAVGK